VVAATGVATVLVRPVAACATGSLLALTTDQMAKGMSKPGKNVKKPKKDKAKPAMAKNNSLNGT